MTEPILVSKAACPHCGSTNLRQIDKMLCAIGIAGWTIESGRPVPHWDDQGSDIFYDTSEVNDPALPFDCADCGAELSEADIVPTFESPAAGNSGEPK